MGRAKVSEQMHNMSSRLLPKWPLGQSLAFSSRNMLIAGKKSTGSGRTNLESAVSLMAFYPAALDFP